MTEIIKDFPSKLYAVVHNCFIIDSHNPACLTHPTFIVMRHCLAKLMDFIAGSDVKPHLTAWKDRGEFMKKLLSLLNFYTPPEMRQATFGWWFVKGTLSNCCIKLMG